LGKMAANASTATTKPARNNTGKLISLGTASSPTEILDKVACNPKIFLDLSEDMLGVGVFQDNKNRTVRAKQVAVMVGQRHEYVTLPERRNLA